MNYLTHFRKILILPLLTFLSLGAIFALATSAYAQNLFVSINAVSFNSDGGIFEYTPTGVQSTYAHGVTSPRGLTFDSVGNLFVAKTLGVHRAPNLGIGTVLKFNLRNRVSTFGGPANDFVFEGLATDIAGNVFVMAQDVNSPALAGTIYKFAPDGTRTIFGTTPGQSFGLAFDSAGNLFAADGLDQTIYEFAPDGTRTVFAGPNAFTDDEGPVGLAFDSAGNLFVSTEGPEDPSPGQILKFTPTGDESTFATGLTYPRGLAFDESGNLFVAEDRLFPDGDILTFAPGGGPPTVFATGLRRPQFLTFGPPR
jgi:sugar lactone lactonase YvrE